MKPIALNRGASPAGWHVIRSYLECPERAARSHSAGNPATSAQNAGLIYHKFLELYRKGGKRGMDTTAIQFATSGVNISSARLIAERAFRAYRVKFPPDYFGKVLGTEIEAEGKLPSWGRTTGRFDLIARLSKPLDLAGRSFSNRMVPTRGEWIVDYKLESGGADPQRYFYDPQFWLYFALRPTVQGVIIDIATKSGSFGLIAIPAAWLRSKQSALALLLDRATTARKLGGYNPLACFTWREACPFLKMCGLHNKGGFNGKE